MLRRFRRQKDGGYEFEDKDSQLLKDLDKLDKVRNPQRQVLHLVRALGALKQKGGMRRHGS